MSSFSPQRAFPDMENFMDTSSGNGDKGGMLAGVIFVVALIIILFLFFNHKRTKTTLPAAAPSRPPPPAAPAVLPAQPPPPVAQIPLATQGPTYPMGAPEPTPYNTLFGKEAQYAEYVPSANYNLQYRQPINATKISLVEIKTPESFQDIVIQNQKDCVCAFISRNCGHCTAMKPAFEQAANQSMIPFLLVEQAVAQPAGLLEKYKVEGFPTIIRFSGGLPVAYFKEARTPENLIKFAK